MRARFRYSRRATAYRERWYSCIDWALVAMIAGAVLAPISLFLILSGIC